MKENKEKGNLLWYFLIFSIIGLAVETLFCYVTTGVIESRKGLILGPFCPIYGVGATIAIALLSKYKGSMIKLFISGAIIGDIVEYIISYGMEAIYGNRFWDYSYTNFHINGRICLLYTIFWGVLAVLLIRVAKPIIDKQLNKIKPKVKKKIEIGVLIFFIFDIIFTVWGVQTYTNRTYEKYQGKEIITQDRNIKEKIEDTIFSDEIMRTVFPNIRIKGENGEEIWASTVQ